LDALPQRIIQEGNTLTIANRQPGLSNHGDTRQRKILSAWDELDDSFEMLVADTPELLDQVYRLRFQVYCREKGFEDSADGHRGREQDDWDAQSKHLLIRHRNSATPLATARLVLSTDDDPQRPFPVEQHVGLDTSTLTTSHWYLPRRSLAEVSRFAISRVVRRQLKGDGMIPNGIADSVLGSWVTLKLVKGLIDLSARHGVDHWYSFMEGGFFRLLQRLGLRFRPTGGPFEFHGRRFLSLDSVDQLMADMQVSQSALFGRMGFILDEMVSASSQSTRGDRSAQQRASATRGLSWVDAGILTDSSALVGA
jgi:N-acyl amino acid synthase of PEP-CTERM/exosortase system